MKLLLKRLFRATLAAWLMALLLAIADNAVAGALEDGQTAWNRHDCPAARRIWLPLAEQGNASAQFKVGMTYEFGGDLGCPPHSDFDAVSWYQKAADQGNADAEEELASLLYAGRGRAKDYDESLKWFKRAAEQGRPFSRYMVGLMHYNGEGTPQDFVAAARWIGQAAEQGLYNAEADLGDLYEKGHGVPQDYVQAYKWIILALAHWPMGGWAQ